MSNYLPTTSCIDTVYVNIPMDDPYTICIEDVLDFEGNIIDAIVCGENLDEVDATAAEWFSLCSVSIPKMASPALRPLCDSLQ